MAEPLARMRVLLNLKEPVSAMASAQWAGELTTLLHLFPCEHQLD